MKKKNNNIVNRGRNRLCAGITRPAMTKSFYAADEEKKPPRKLQSSSKGTEGNIPEPRITPRTFRMHATKGSPLVGPINQHASSHRTNKLDIQFEQLHINYATTEQAIVQKLSNSSNCTETTLQWSRQLRRNYARTEQISEQKKEKTNPDEEDLPPARCKCVGSGHR
jgi:hypothetical protein